MEAMAIGSVTTVYCPRGLRQLWREEGSTVPAQWYEQYPALFDDDDLRIAQGPQRVHHFCEWFAAIYLFHRDGARSLVEKYDTYENHWHNQLRRRHRRKVAEYERVVPEDQRRVLHEIGSTFRVQLPDLLVISNDGTSFSFAEVKGPGDGLSPDQADANSAISERLGVSVEILKVEPI
jgi:hypothetical protein